MNNIEYLFPVFQAYVAVPAAITERNVRLYLEIETAVERVTKHCPAEFQAEAKLEVLIAFSDREGVTLGEIEDVWRREDNEWIEATEQARTLSGLLAQIRAQRPVAAPKRRAAARRRAA